MHLRTLAALVAAPLAVALLSGCGGSETPPADKPTAAPSTTATAEPTEDAKPDYCSGATFTGPAADEFGAENVKAAYCQMVAFTVENSFTDELMRNKDSFAPAEFDFLKQHMTPRMQQTWDEGLPKALAGEKEEEDAYASMTFWDITLKGYALAQDGDPLAVNPTWSPGETAVDTSEGSPRLEMTVNTTADIRMVEETSGKPVVLRVEKKVTYWLVPPAASEGTDGLWLIDGFSGRFTARAPRAA